MLNWAVGSIVPFMLVTIPLVLSPGPDTMLIIRNTLASGKGVGMAAVAGVQLGLMAHLMLALVGISLFVLGFPELYSLLVLLGAVYLTWLGLQSFVQRGRMKLGVGKQVGWRFSTLSAMLTNLLNPKVLVLFFTLLPGFVALDAPIRVEAQLLLLVTVLIVINSLWQGALVVFCDRLSRWLQSPGVNKMLGRVCGVALLVFAVLMIYEHSWR